MVVTNSVHQLYKQLPINFAFRFRFRFKGGGGAVERRKATGERLVFCSGFLAFCIFFFHSFILLRVNRNPDALKVGRADIHILLTRSRL